MRGGGLQLVCGLLWIGVACLPVWGYSRGMSNAKPRLTAALRVMHAASTLGIGAVLFGGVALAHADQPGQLDTAPAAPSPAAPRWTGAHAHLFPRCVATDKARFLPSRVVVVTGHGPARVMPYTPATVARIAATWAEGTDPASRVHTIGACR